MTQVPTDVTASHISQADVATIASRQKILILLILAHIVIYTSVLLLPLPAAVLTVLQLASLAVSITAMVFIFLLATKLYGTALGVVLGILTIIPLVGLVILLIVNVKAVKILRAAGIDVGLLGAKHPVAG